MSILSSAAALPGRYVGFMTSSTIVAGGFNPLGLTNRQSLVGAALYLAIRASPLDKAIDRATYRAASALASAPDDLSTAAVARDIATSLTVGIAAGFVVLLACSTVAKSVA